MELCEAIIDILGSIVVTNVLVLKHQVISILSTDSMFIVQYHYHVIVTSNVKRPAI